MAGKLLRRVEAAEFLTLEGYPTALTTLNKLATVGGGPKFLRFGRIPLYDPDDLLAWAHARCSQKVASTSELEPQVA